MQPASPLASAVPASAAAALVLDIAGQTVARTVLGLANQIIVSANNVRVNRAAALALSRRVNETVDVVLSLSGEDAVYRTDEQPLEAFEVLQSTLEDVRDSLVAFQQRSYLSQVVHQMRDKELIQEQAQRVENAFNLLMVKLRIQSVTMAAALSSTIATMAANRPSQLSALPTAEAHSDTLARLPPRPHLHFGRMHETQTVLDSIVADSAGRVAILGGPGMGKTTLAVAVLHHPSVIERFGARRFFVPCEAAEGQASCLATIADAFGVTAKDQNAVQKKLLEAIGEDRAVLVLDNFESAWEAIEQRSAAEQVLQLLDGLPQLALLLTMRGTERPGGVRWTRPFLPPLAPLSDIAARQTFFSIADVSDSDSTIENLIDHLDNIPLAIVLLANLVQFESPESLFRRWDELKTAMLVRDLGQHRLASLDVSIELSLRCPRMLAVPAAQSLLSILALLPNGVVDTDISLWELENTSQAVSTLLQTSLASRNSDQRIHVLAPIRDFMQRHYPPNDSASPVLRHYFSLAELAHEASKFGFDAEAIAEVAPELGNIDAVVRYAFRERPDSHSAAIAAAKCMAILYSETSMGTGNELLHAALAVASKGEHDALRADLLFEWARMSVNRTTPGDPEKLYRDAHDIYERLGNVGGVLDTATALTQFLPPAAAVAEARRLYAIAESRQDARRTARCAYMRARGHEHGGQPRDAIEQYELAISTWRRVAGDAQIDRLVGACKYRIGENLLFLGNYAAGIEAEKDALAIFEKLRFRQGETIILGQLASILQLQGRPLEAIDLATRGLAVPGARDFRAYQRCLLTLVESNAMIGNLEASTSALERIEELVQAGSVAAAEQSSILATRADLAQTRGDVAEARALASAAHTASRSRDLVYSREEMLHKEANMLALGGIIALADDCPEEASICAINAVVHFHKVMDTVSPIICLVLLAESAEDDLATRLIDALLLPVLRLGLAYDMAKLLLRSATVAQHRDDMRLARRRAENAVRRFGEIKDDKRLEKARRILEIV